MAKLEDIKKVKPFKPPLSEITDLAAEGLTNYMLNKIQAESEPIELTREFDVIDMNDTDFPEELRNDADRIRNSYYYARNLGITTDEAYEYEPELNRQLYGPAASSSSAWQQTSRRILSARRKGVATATVHGGIGAYQRVRKSVAGLGRMVAEIKGLQGSLLDPAFRWIHDLPEDVNIDKYLVNVSNAVKADIEQYYTEHPELGYGLDADAGYAEQLWQMVSRPENLVQGLVEAVPMVLEGVFGGAPAMAIPIIGDVYLDARSEGTGIMSSFLQSVSTGVIEAEIENWTLGRKIGLAKNFRSMLRESGTRKVLWEGVKAFFRGTAEEGSQEFNRNFWQWLLTDRSQKWFENVQTSMAMGGPLEAAMSGAFAGAGYIATPVDVKEAKARLNVIRKAVRQSDLSSERKAEILEEIDLAEEGVVKDIITPAEKAPEPPAEARTPAEAAAEGEGEIKGEPSSRIQQAMSKLGYKEADKSDRLKIGGRVYTTITSSDGKVRFAITDAPLYVQGNDVLMAEPSDRTDEELKQLTVEGIVVEPEARGEGVGRRAMLELQQAADEQGITLIGEPEQMRGYVEEGQKGLGKQELVEWYKRLGWTQKQEGSDILLEYKPKSRPTPAPLAPEGKVMEEEETPEEAEAATKQLEAEGAELVEPNLYIGNVTAGMKKRMAAAMGVEASDIHGFTEKGFTTKRKKIQMTRSEAEAYLEWLETDIMRRLDENLVNTENQQAWLQADWGDIVTLREVLGLPKIAAPFRVIRGEKYVPTILDFSKTLGELYSKEELVELAKDIGIEVEGKTKKQLEDEINRLADEGMTKAERIVDEARQKILSKAAKIIRTRSKAIAEAIRPTVESKMTVGQVLRAVLKRSARYSKMGYAQGRRELRADLRAKARAKRRMNTALKKIKQNIPKSVDFFYREAIDALRSDIDLKRRSERTESNIKSRKEFLERVPEATKDIPVKLIRQIGQKSLNDMTIEELENIASQIDTLIKQGKLKRKLKLKPETEKRNTDIKNLTERTEQLKPSRKKAAPEGMTVTKKGILDKVFDITKPLTWRPSRLFDWLDGKKNFRGLWHKIFYDDTKEARAAIIRNIDNSKQAFKKERERLGITLWDLAGTREVDGIRYQLQEMMGIYMASKNELSKLALLYGGAQLAGDVKITMTEESIQNIIDAMTDSERALADWLLGYYDRNHPRLRRSVIEQENRDMGRQENYSPIIRVGLNYSTLSSEFIDSIIHREALRRHLPAKGMTIERKNVPPNLQTAIRVDAIDIWDDQLQKTERYIEMGPQVRRMNKIMANRKLRTAISERFGNELVEAISGRNGYISRVANPYVYRQFSDIEKLSGILRRNTALAYLAYNVVTMGKQLPSAFLYLADAGPSHLMASALDFARNPMAMIEKVRSLDPEVKSRAIERELEELKNSTHGSLLAQKIGYYGMEGIYFFDAVARTIGWNAVYERVKAEQGEAEAIRQARNATLRTQPAAAPEDLPALYTTNEFLNWFTMFTNQLNQIYNIGTYDIPSYLQNKQYAEAALSTTAMAIVAMTIWMVSNRKVPDEPEEFAAAIGEQFVNSIPLIGRPILAGFKGWESDLPAFQFAKGLGMGAKGLSDWDLSDKDYQQIAEGLSIVMGIPYTAIHRSVQAITEGQPTALLGARKPTKKRGTKKRKFGG